MDKNTYNDLMNNEKPSPALIQKTKYTMKDSIRRDRTVITLRPRFAIVAVVVMLMVTLSTVTLAATGVFHDFFYPPFYTAEGEFIDPMAEYEYALKIYQESGGASRSYYTREELAQYFSELMSESEAAGLPYVDMLTDVRQPHIQPVPLFRESTGMNGPHDLCDNTVYASIDGQRVCFSCGYIFTEEQNIAIGWKAEG